MNADPREPDTIVVASRNRGKLAEQAWVEDVQTMAQGEGTRLLITVSDEAAAKTHLLRLLSADSQLIVTEFGRKTYELEEIFVDIVQGGQRGK